MATEHELNIDVLIHIFSQLSAVDLVRSVLHQVFERDLIILLEHLV